MTLNKGTLVPSPIRPRNTNSTYPVAINNEIRGGYHTYETIVERDSIPTQRRSWGMLCYITNDIDIQNNGLYFLRYIDNSSDITDNSNWIKVNLDTYEIISISDATNLMANNLITPNKLYIIEGVDINLYGGTTIFVRGMQSNVLDSRGFAQFYNPKYNQSIDGYGIFDTSNTYDTDDTTIWGGKHWVNISGNNGTIVDIFTLSNDWEEIPYNDEDYNVVYNEIFFDWVNLIITERIENDNSVKTSLENISYWSTQFGAIYGNPIKSFQWGNYLNNSFEIGVGNTQIDNSYYEIINFKGKYLYNIYMNINSWQRNLNIGINSFQNSITLTNGSFQNNITLSGGSLQQYIVMDNGSYQENININNNSYQFNLSFSNGSHQELIDIIDNSFQERLSFNNNSSQQNCNIEYYASQTDIHFNNESYQLLVDIGDFGYQSLMHFDNNSFQRDIVITDGLYQTKLYLLDYHKENANNPFTNVDVNSKYIGNIVTSTMSSYILTMDNNDKLVKVDFSENDSNRPINITYDGLTGSNQLTLGNNHNIGLPDIISASTVGSSSSIPVITYDNKGRIISTTTSNITLNSNIIYDGLTGDSILNIGDTFSFGLPNIITASTIGSSTSIPIITYDNKGRITDVVSVNVNIPSNVINQGGNSYGTTVSIGTNDNQPLVLKTNNVERFRIANSGDITVNTVGTFSLVNGSSNNNDTIFSVSDNTNKTNIELKANGNIISSRLLLSPTYGISSTFSNLANLFIQTDNSLSTGNSFIISNTQSGQIFRVNNQGTVFANGSISTIEGRVSLGTQGASITALFNDRGITLNAPKGTQGGAMVTITGNSSVGAIGLDVRPNGSNGASNFVVGIQSRPQIGDNILGTVNTSFGIRILPQFNAGTYGAYTGIDSDSVISGASHSHIILRHGNNRHFIVDTLGNAILSASHSVNTTYSIATKEYVDSTILTGAVLQNGNTLGATLSIGSNDNQPLVFKTNNTNRLLINNTGSIIANTVGGFTINNSTSGTPLLITHGGAELHRFGTDYSWQTDGTRTTFSFTGGKVTITGNQGANTGAPILTLNNINASSTVGENTITGGVDTLATLTRSSGNWGWASYRTGVTINQTGTASGITRGYWANPTLTSAFSWRSFEWANNIGWGLYGEGNAPSFIRGRLQIGTTISDGSLLQLNGTASVLNVNGNSANNTIFRVSGSSGELFSVVDSLTGSLMSVNDISGLPIFEVFSDSSILMGDTNYPSYNTTRRIVTVTGSNTIISLTQSLYDGVFVDYVARRDNNVRAGNLLATYFGTTISTAEYTTSDIGDTSGLIIDATISGGNINVYASSSTANWVIKTIIRSI